MFSAKLRARLPFAPVAGEASLLSDGAKWDTGLACGSDFVGKEGLSVWLGSGVGRCITAQ